MTPHELLDSLPNDHARRDWIKDLLNEIDSTPLEAPLIYFARGWASENLEDPQSVYERGYADGYNEASKDTPE